VKLRNSVWAVLVPVVAGILIAVVFQIKDRYRGYTRRSIQSEGLSYAKAYQSAQQSHFQEFGRYAESADKLGFAVAGSRFRVCASDEDIPQAYRGRIKPSQMPFLSKSDYRILVVGGEPEAMTMWLVVPASEPQMIERLN
jgi:hypothetical protein